MGKYDQLAKEMAALSKTLESDAGRRTTQALNDQLGRQLELVETSVPPHARLIRDRTRVANQFRDAISRFVLGSEPLMAAIALKECIDSSVLPYVWSAAYEETSRTQLPRHSGAEGLTGITLGDWILQDCIGSGGDSFVYRAEQVMTGLIACVKVIPVRTDQKKQQQDRFHREIRVPARIGHTALVEVYAAGANEDLGVLYIAMRLVNGAPINRWAQRKARREIVNKFISLLEPITLCHVHSVVHRDLKHNNVLVSVDDRISILDFGVSAIVGRSTHTQTGQFLGTVNYVSPEQARDPRKATAQSDIWSLGVMLYELLSGFTVFPQESDVQVLAAVLGGHFAPPEATLPAPLARIIRRCLQVDPNHRYGSVKELADELRAEDGKVTLSSAPLIDPAPLPRQELPPLNAFSGALADHGPIEVPVADPQLSPYTLEFDTCDFCHATGMWHGNRCTRCGKYRGTD